MIKTIDFHYRPSDDEAEKASNSYLMSVIAVMAGLPFPIINLIATAMFFVGNRKGTHFVRWHAWQSLLSQFSFIFMNSAAFWWTIDILFFSADLSNSYFGYMLTVIVFNLIEFIATIYSAIQTRKGKHTKWWFYGDIADLICKN